MIQEVKGDILLTGAEAIIHGVAPNDHFNTGLAHSLREQWPAMAKDFRHYCHAQSPKPGTLFSWAGVGKRIISLLTQDEAVSENSHPEKASLSHVRHALDALQKEIQKEKIKSIALPKLACGVGGLNWQEVLPLIKEKLGNLNIPVIIYSEFHAGLKASEKL